jgi:hypothetical protein
MENAVNALLIIKYRVNFLRVFSARKPKQNMTAVLKR